MKTRTPPQRSWNEGRVFERTQWGHFKEGAKQYDERIMSPEHKEKVRKAAILRANTQYRQISVCGVIYPNLARAADAVGVSRRSLRLYAESISVIFDHIFFVDAPTAAIRNNYDSKPTPEGNRSAVAAGGGDAHAASAQEPGDHPTRNGHPAGLDD